jgi:hypothetical protein
MRSRFGRLVKALAIAVDVHFLIAKMNACGAADGLNAGVGFLKSHI